MARPLLLLLPLALAACNRSVPPAPDNAATANAVANMTAAVAFRDTADPQTDGEPGRCAFGGWSLDKDPAGLAVHAEPSPGSAVVGRLPPPVVQEDNEWASGFDVVESANGWFRIQRAYSYSKSARRMLDVSGWIEGSKLGFELQTDAAFAEPDPASPPVALSWRDSDDGDHHFAFRNPTECKGHWVKLSVAGHDGRERQGWARGVCGTQESSCDGDSYDTLGDRLVDYPRY